MVSVFRGSGSWCVVVGVRGGVVRERLRSEGRRTDSMVTVVR
jgi:hypothetical protein